MKKVIKDIIRALGIIIILFTTACESEKIEPVDVGSLPEVINYDEHIAPIFDNKCTKCHGGQTPPNLSLSESFINLTAGGYINTSNPEGSTLYKEITTGGMAQYASDLDRAYILKWIQQYAEEQN